MKRALGLVILLFFMVLPSCLRRPPASPLRPLATPTAFGSPTDTPTPGPTFTPSGTKMGSLSAAQVQVIRDWISQGALNN